jgi:arsenate reductase
MSAEIGGVKMLKVLFLCTHNSARSQIAEALLNLKGKDRIIAYSAGSEPAEEINPLAVKVMQEIGIDISGKKPKPIENYINKPFDLVITLCDRARNQCPALSGNAVRGHWGIDDPEYFEGTDEKKLKHFRRITTELSTRIDLLLALPLEKSDKVLLKQKLDNILKTDQT